MGLRDLQSIDIMLRAPPFEKEDCALVLLIVDSTTDLPDDERYTMLIRKLATYLAYVAATSFTTEHPGLRPSDVIVRVLTVVPPTPEMLQVDAVKTKDQTARLRVFFDDYAAYMAKVKAPKPGEPSSN